jgi:hypothetical protein
MRGLEESLARMARRDDLRERSGSGRGGAHRVERPTPAGPSVSPVVDEVAEALQAVVLRNPGVFATVVVQEADTAWSVWIGEWDGTLRTRVTQLEPDPPAVTAAGAKHPVDTVAAPTEDGDTVAFAVPEPLPPPAALPVSVADPAPAPAAAPVPVAAPPPVPVPAAVSTPTAVPTPAPAPAAVPVAPPLPVRVPASRRPPVAESAAGYPSAERAAGYPSAERAAGYPSSAPTSPAPYPGIGPYAGSAVQTSPPATMPATRPVNGPAMNDRVAGRIAELLRREAARETRGA